MILNIRHVGIVVDDLEASLRFYRDLLGFQIKVQMDESGSYIDNVFELEDVKVTTVKLSGPDGQMIELLEFHTHKLQRQVSKVNNIGITHIAFSVEDLDAVYEKMKLEGIYCNCPPQYSPDGFAKLIYCKAPEGTYIELVEELQQ